MLRPLRPWLESDLHRRATLAQGDIVANHVASTLTKKFRYIWPPLPGPLLQRRRGNSRRRDVTKLRCRCTSPLLQRRRGNFRRHDVTNFVTVVLVINRIDEPAVLIAKKPVKTPVGGLDVPFVALPEV